MAQGLSGPAGLTSTHPLGLTRADVLALWVRAETEPSPTDTPSDLRKRTDRDPELFVVATDGSEVIGSLMRGGMAGGETCIGLP